MPATVAAASPNHPVHTAMPRRSRVAPAWEHDREEHDPTQEQRDGREDGDAVDRVHDADHRAAALRREEPASERVGVLHRSRVADLEGERALDRMGVGGRHPPRDDVGTVVEVGHRRAHPVAVAVGVLG